MTDKEAYEAAVKLANAQRCITCDHYKTDGQKATCDAYECELPMDCLYTPNDCEKWVYSIPF